MPHIKYININKRLFNNYQALLALLLSAQLIQSGQLIITHRTAKLAFYYFYFFGHSLLATKSLPFTSQVFPDVSKSSTQVILRFCCTSFICACISTS